MLLLYLVLFSPTALIVGNISIGCCCWSGCEKKVFKSQKPPQRRRGKKQQREKTFWGDDHWERFCQLFKIHPAGSNRGGLSQPHHSPWLFRAKIWGKTDTIYFHHRCRLWTSQQFLWHCCKKISVNFKSRLISIDFHGYIEESVQFRQLPLQSLRNKYEKLVTLILKKT